MKSFITKLKYFLESFYFLKTFFSPFKPLRARIYFGKISIGHPYFLPRRLTKDRKFVPIRRLGFDYNHLGWKTKFSDYDVRFEWSPSYSFIILGYQLNVSFLPNIDSNIDPYWEAWIIYNYKTNKKYTKKERLKHVFENYNCTWSWSKNGEKYKEDHYLNILSNKWIPFYKEWKLEQSPEYRRNKKIDLITE